MRQKKKPASRKADVARETDGASTRKRRNSFEPQVIVPHQVDLPLNRPDIDEVAVPAAPNGRSFINGRF